MLIASFLAKDPLAALLQDKSLKCYSTGRQLPEQDSTVWTFAAVPCSEVFSKPITGSKRLVLSEVFRVSREHPTLGYKKVAAKLRSLGYRANKKML